MRFCGYSNKTSVSTLYCLILDRSFPINVTGRGSPWHKYFQFSFRGDRITPIYTRAREVLSARWGTQSVIRVSLFYFALVQFRVRALDPGHHIPIRNLWVYPPFPIPPPPPPPPPTTRPFLDILTTHQCVVHENVVKSAVCCGKFKFPRWRIR